jgi:hypothetical protein
VLAGHLEVTSEELGLTEVVNQDEEACTQHGTEPCTAPNVAVQEYAGRDGGIFLLPPLDDDEADDQEDEDDKQSDYASALPLILAATPLQRKKQADDSRQEKRRTGKIELLKLLFPCRLDLFAPPLDVQKRDDEGSRERTKGKVDIEAPSPGQLVCECSTHTKYPLAHVDRGKWGNLQWTSNRRNTIHAANKSHVRRPLPQRHRHRDDQDGSREDTSSAHTRNRTADDQSRGVRGDTADERADLEDEQGNEVDPFDAVEGVEFAVNKLCCAGGEEICGAIPADVVEGFELICDAGDSCCDDCVILNPPVSSASI